MRLLVEILIIGGLISLGWETPFREWENRVTSTVQTFLQSKHQTSSSVITTPVAITQRQSQVTLRSVSTRKLRPVR
jgi:hypothetical protein